MWWLFVGPSRSLLSYFDLLLPLLERFVCRELVAFHDDGLRLFSDAIVLFALFAHGLLSELCKSLIGCFTAPADSENQ
jgi:hypothetical protein